MSLHDRMIKILPCSRDINSILIQGERQSFAVTPGDYRRAFVLGERIGLMAKKRKTSSADRLFERLGAAATSTGVFTGMIKRAEGNKNSIMFARAGDCSKWVKIPADHIADIKLIHMVSCDGHTHPLVHLFMKEPTSPEAKTFAALARLHQTPPSVSHTVVSSRHLVGLAATGQPGSTPCYWDWGLNQWVCPSS